MTFIARSVQPGCVVKYKNKLRGLHQSEATNLNQPLARHNCGSHDTTDEPASRRYYAAKSLGLGIPSKIY